MRKLFGFALILMALILASNFLVSASVVTGVKKGDWIEYNVSVTGNPPEGHDAKWARMEVSNVQGNALNLNVTTQFTKGSFLYENITLNLETGELVDDFFIPANLNAGQSFMDAHSGNISINKIEQRNYAGALRSVVTGNTIYTSFYWDQQTGILVEAHSEYKDINFTMTTVAEKTNMWQPQTAILYLTIIYSIIVLIIMILAFASILIWRRKHQSRGYTVASK
jgi:hypothetical protein